VLALFLVVLKTVAAPRNDLADPTHGKGRTERPSHLKFGRRRAGAGWRVDERLFSAPRCGLVES